MYLEKLLTEITQMLDCLKIPYLLTGSLAFNIYSVPRATRDIDLIIEISDNDSDKLIAAINGKFYYNAQTIKEEIKRKGMFNIIHLESTYKIDLIVCPDDEFEAEKFRRRQPINLFGDEIYVATIEDLTISKLRWIQQTESELQKRDIAALLSNPNIDIDYVKKWCKKMRLKTFKLIEL